VGGGSRPVLAPLVVRRLSSCAVGVYLGTTVPVAEVNKNLIVRILLTYIAHLRGVGAPVTIHRTAFATIPLSFSSRTWGTVEVTVLYIVAHNQGMAIGDAGFCATYCVPRLDGSGSYVRTCHVARKVSTIKYY
jgi:hypothetical protein